MSTQNGSRYDDDIVVRRLSDPLAIASLVVAAICIMGAIALQITEVYLYRGEDRTEVNGAAAAYVRDLDSQYPVRGNLTKFEDTLKAAKASTVVQGKLTSTGFEAVDTSAFAGLDVKKVVQELLDTYGYGGHVMSPALKTQGIQGDGSVQGGGADEVNVDTSTMDSLSPDLDDDANKTESTDDLDSLDSLDDDAGDTSDDLSDPLK